MHRVCWEGSGWEGDWGLTPVRWGRSAGRVTGEGLPLLGGGGLLGDTALCMGGVGRLGGAPGLPGGVGLGLLLTSPGLVLPSLGLLPPKSVRCALSIVQIIVLGIENFKRELL